MKTEQIYKKYVRISWDTEKNTYYPREQVKRGIHNILKKWDRGGSYYENLMYDVLHNLYWGLGSRENLENELDALCLEYTYETSLIDASVKSKMGNQ
jgi:hypothetical protein